MNILALVIFIAVLFFVVLQVKGLVTDVIKRRKQRNDNKSELKGGNKEDVGN